MRAQSLPPHPRPIWLGSGPTQRFCSRLMSGRDNRVGTQRMFEYLGRRRRFRSPAGSVAVITLSTTEDARRTSETP
jgi:hypothetical protein